MFVFVAQPAMAIVYVNIQSPGRLSHEIQSVGGMLKMFAYRLL